MTAYEKELLALAVVWCRERGKDFCASHIPGEFWHEDENGIKGFGEGGGSEAEALTALLRDLGVEVPERPSVNTKTASGVSIRALEGLFTYGQWAGSLVHLRSLYAREPLIVLALLEGGES